MPALVDPVTGEIIRYCRSRLCEYCSKTEAVKMAFKVMRAEPSHEFALTMIGYTPEEWQVNKKAWLRNLRRIGPFEWWLAVEISPQHRLPHVHGFAKTSITQHQFQVAANSAGLGICELKKVPADRARLAKHFAYPMKSLDDPDFLAEFLEWNAKGTKIGFESHSHGFFQKTISPHRIRPQPVSTTPGTSIPTKPYSPVRLIPPENESRASATTAQSWRLRHLIGRRDLRPRITASVTPPDYGHL